MAGDPFDIDPSDPLAIGDQAFDDIRECIARHGLENLLSRGCIGARAPANVDSNRIDDLAVDRRSMAAQPDVGRLMIAAASRASRPMHRQRRAGRTQPRLERLRGSTVDGGRAMK